MNLQLKPYQIRILEEEGRLVYPIEACGIFLGKMSLTKAIVQKVIITPNILQSRKRFEINPETVIKAINESTNEGLDLVGFFHSHPEPHSNPSVIDLKFMKLWGNAIWVIFSVPEEKLTAFQMKNEKLNKIPIRIK